MPLTEEQKKYIVDNAVEILQSPDREKRMTELRDKVMNAQGKTEIDQDDALYSVLQALEELYGK